MAQRKSDVQCSPEQIVAHSLINRLFVLLKSDFLKLYKPMNKKKHNFMMLF